MVQDKSFLYIGIIVIVLIIASKYGLIGGSILPSNVYSFESLGLIWECTGSANNARGGSDSSIGDGSASSSHSEGSSSISIQSSSSGFSIAASSSGKQDASAGVSCASKNFSVSNAEEVLIGVSGSFSVSGSTSNPETAQANMMDFSYVASTNQLNNI